MIDGTALVATLANLTTALTALTAVLVALTLVDCAFIYRRITAARKKQLKRE